MLKHSLRSANTPATLTRHEQEMVILRAHHERVMNDPALREAMLVGAGIFMRTVDGNLVVAKPYDKVIVPKRAA